MRGRRSPKVKMTTVSHGHNPEIEGGEIPSHMGRTRTGLPRTEVHGNRTFSALDRKHKLAKPCH